MGNTYTVTVPQQAPPLPAREAALEPMVGVLLDAAETLTAQLNTDWIGEPLTELERDLALLTVRSLCQLMIHGLGLWEEPS